MAVIVFLVVSLLHQVQYIQSTPLSSYIVSSFISPDPIMPFNNIATYNVTGDIYIGADRRLYQLDSDLTLKQYVTVDSCPDQPADLSNDNKMVVVAPHPVEKLVTCWSCDEYCETRSLADVIANVVKHVSPGADVVDTDGSVVGTVSIGADFIQPGEGKLGAELYLFTGVSLPSSGQTEPVRKHDLKNLTSQQRTDRYNIDDLQKNDYLQVFNFKKFTYFSINRQTKANIRTVYFGRLCTDSLDRTLDSYTEIELRCAGATSSYKVVRAVHIGLAGPTLSHSIGINSDEYILYAVFTENESSAGRSAFCVYKMSDIQRSFADAVAGCIEGKDRPGNDYIDGSHCGADAGPTLNTSSYECTAYESDVRGPVYIYASGKDPLVAAPLLTWTGSAPTSIMTIIERDHTIAVVGNTDGDMMKINLVNESYAYIYESVDLGSGSVLKDTFLHDEQEEITLALSSDEEASENKVLRLSLANCSQYQTCEECIGLSEGYLGDPYCGWCTLEARLSHFESKSTDIAFLTYSCPCVCFILTRIIYSN